MKTLITGAFQYDEVQLKELEKLNLEIEYMQDETQNSNIDFRKFECVICNSLFLYQDIKRFENLKMIQLTSSGLDRVPLEYIKQKNIILYHARDVYSIPMAEWVLLKILESYKNSKRFYEQQKQKIWKKDRDILELNHKKVAIVGYGSVGQEIAKRLKAFNAEVIAISRTEKIDEYIDAFYPISNLEDAIKEMDIVILTLPLTEQTEGMFNAKLFEKMKQGSIFVNVSRGKIMNEKDLIISLKNKKFKSVILDVFEKEPLSEKSKLWEFENVFITPHNSFVGEYNKERLFKVIKKNILEYKEGKKI